MDAIRNALLRAHNEVTLTITCLGSIIIAIIANRLYALLMDIPGDNVRTLYKIIIVSTLIIGTIVMVFAFSCLVIWAKKRVWPDYMDEYYMKYALLHLRDLGGKRQGVFQKTILSPEKDETDKLLLQLALDNMQLSIQCCYDFFESAFTNKGQLVNEIKFEVTFMTKSYIDSEITIPCSANKEGRSPTSMLLRADNSKIYADTETAKIYEMKHPVMILIEDTSLETNKYKEIYQDQKKRIKSSVILPVLSQNNELLGTLVVHCNQASFFKKNRYQFWSELLDMFAVELGYYKEMLDYYICSKADLRKPF